MQQYMSVKMEHLNGTPLLLIYNIVLDLYITASYDVCAEDDGSLAAV